MWTSLAQTADFGICLARSAPDAGKHAGITYFIVDMRAEGIDIRPLRELTGAAMFNEVFFNDVSSPTTPSSARRARLAHRADDAGQRALDVDGRLLGPGVEALTRTVRVGASAASPARPAWSSDWGT